MPATPEHDSPPSREGPTSSERRAHLYLAGDIIAQKYRLTRLLGEGGMGAVWLARNIKLDVDVAIKLIRHEAATADTSDRLLKEARAAARIGHRSIVRIFDFGETELDDPFIVMEVLTGESLRDVLERKGRLPATNAVTTLLPIASALVEAHAAGIVHRDLKPENIMLMPDKSGAMVPKLVDFGIAKFARSEEEPSEDGAGSVVGTPDYMSPEQAGGHDEVDETADVWALGVILYEAITGRVPFSGPNTRALAFAIMTEEPAPITEQAAGDAALSALLTSALAKRNVDRPSMFAFGTALAEWAIAHGVGSDIAGTSLSAHWGKGAKRSPFSIAPPANAVDPRVDHVVAIPRAAALPGAASAARRMASTEAPPSLEGAAPGEVEAPRAKGRGRWVAAAAFAALGAFVVAAKSGSFSMASPPIRSPTVETHDGLATTAPVESPALPPAPAVPDDSARAPAAEPAPEVPSAAVSSPEPAASAPLRPWPKKLPRKGTLPVAKHPNF